jgi:hypothetical protein
MATCLVAPLPDDALVSRVAQAAQTARVLCLFLALGAALVAQGFHQRFPTQYRKAKDDNAITALNLRLQAGEVQLPSVGQSGRLRALLAALAVPESSQMLVFSKTSLQRHRISPGSPRALFFGPDVYVGWVPGAAMLEVAAGDARLGLVFYTLVQDPEQAPVLRRDDSCLSCHGGERTDDEPGLLLRSVFPDAAGDPISSAGEALVTFRSPLAERWGGWLVTGHFAGPHRGNGTAVRDDAGNWRVAGRVAADLGAFAEDFAVGDYPVRTSDVGALMALEQQVTVHNLLIRASLQVRTLLACDAALHGPSDEPGMRDPTARIVDRLARQIATTLMFGDEAPLTDRDAVADGTFAAAFASQWPRDSAGRSLGQLDLRERVFVLPLSPMVHSPAFAAMPPELRDAVLERLRVALGRGRFPGGVAMTADQRLALHAHLRATLAGY